ncbi:MAG: hypothetical protein ABSG68_02195 [Thermoguttaceae bacterium]|jgi:hypothetical protein
MRRRAIGIIAILLLAIGLSSWLWLPGEGWQQSFQAVCCRVGAVMAALWLAYPDLERMPGWIWAIVPALVLIVAKWPKLLLLVIPALIVAALMKPKLGGKR